ncbi:hypothetical protein [Sandaracinus amylolyticus]|uniref:hypothetical protein n=1 Tax=Sandaracinus amylolyticus TaxID=927083 RepID=UPI001F2F04F0|nr:hypothetical protein [Sandaracinus amylolyticus]UJR84198.1 Hypothetical protein I5071_62690 [Sandaracinus amylolyticus]
MMREIPTRSQPLRGNGHTATQTDISEGLEETKPWSKPPSHDIEQLRRAGISISAELIVAATRAAQGSEASEIGADSQLNAAGRFVAARGAQFAPAADIVQLVEELKLELSDDRRNLSVESLVELWALAEPNLVDDERRELWPLVVRRLGGGEAKVELSRNGAAQGGGY